MPIDTEKVEKLKTILELTNDGLSEKKFALVIKSLVDFVKRVRDGLDTRFVGLETNINTKVSQIKDGKDGKNGVNGKDGIGIKGERGEQGKEGESVKGVNGADGSSDTPQMIINKIRFLNKKGLKVSDINGLQKLLDDLDDRERRLGKRVSGGGLNVASWTIRMIDNELLGTGDGIETDFTLNHFPSPATSLHIHVGTAEMFLTDDWTLSNKIVTFLIAPPNGSKIRGTYKQG